MTQFNITQYQQGLEAAGVPEELAKEATKIRFEGCKSQNDRQTVIETTSYLLKQPSVVL